MMPYKRPQDTVAERWKLKGREDAQDGKHKNWRSHIPVEYRTNYRRGWEQQRLRMLTDEPIP